MSQRLEWRPSANLLDHPTLCTKTFVKKNLLFVMLFSELASLEFNGILALAFDIKLFIKWVYFVVLSFLYFIN
jgi:hypothetical protein